MNKLAFIEFGTLFNMLGPEQELAANEWLTLQQSVAGGQNLLERLTKEGFTVVVVLPTRPSADKTVISEWLTTNGYSFNRLDLPRAISPTLSFERWTVSRLHDMDEFEEPQRIVALLQPASQETLNSQLNGALLDWQPKSLVLANTVEQAVSRFLGVKRSLSLRPA